MHCLLTQPEAAPAVTLLRLSFVGFLGEVKLTDPAEWALADFLTSKGVLLRPSPVRPYYHMALSLLDGFI